MYKRIMKLEQQVANCRPNFRRVRFRRIEIDHTGRVLYYFDGYDASIEEDIEIKVDGDNLFVMWFEGLYRHEWVSYNKVRSTQRIMLETYGKKFVVIRSRLESILEELEIGSSLSRCDRVDQFLLDYTWDQAEWIYDHYPDYIEYEELT